MSKYFIILPRGTDESFSEVMLLSQGNSQLYEVFIDVSNKISLHCDLTWGC